MNIVCLKWGDKFNHQHVNRLYKMVNKNYKDKFNFICYTENSSFINTNIEIRNLDLNYDLEKLNMFYSQVKYSDEFRGENFGETFPEFYKLLKKYGNAPEDF